jgi:hypothetical protein
MTGLIAHRYNGIIVGLEYTAEFCKRVRALAAWSLKIEYTIFPIGSLFHSTIRMRFAFVMPQPFIDVSSA